MMTARVQFRINGKPLQVDLSVPEGPMHQQEILPAVHAMADAVIGIAVEFQVEQGDQVSCRMGCAACCRQLVPIAGVEARRIAALVEAMPEPRRSAIRARFDEARARLDAAGLLAKLADPESHGTDALVHAGAEYFSLGLACPFLEDELCSIYADRPVACREYLVTTPAENCWHVNEAEVVSVPLPMEVSRALIGMDYDPASTFVPWTPLSLSLEWAAAHPDEPAPRPGPDVLREFLNRATGRA